MRKRAVNKREARINKFYKFLIAENAFVEYRENVRRGNMSNLNIIFRNKATSWIAAAFLYDESKEGIIYWVDLSMKWREYCETEGLS